MAVSLSGEAHTSSKTVLVRRIGLYSATAIVVGSMIGSGIFRSPAGIAANVPDTSWMLGVWLLGGLVALCGALTLAELGSAIPETGGVYVYIRDNWGALPAFLFGWAELVLIRPASTGALAMTCAEYAVRTMRVFANDASATLGTSALAQHPTLVRSIAVGAVVITIIINVLGVRSGARVQSVLTSAKCGALLLIIGAAFASLLWMPENTVATTSTSADIVAPVTMAGVGLALVSVLWVYDGWADLSFVSGEVVNPRRTLPLALVGGTLAVIGIYLLANLAYLAVLPVESIARSPLVAADVADTIFGSWGVLFVGVTVAVSTFGTLAASMLTGPRIIWAAAEDGLLFRPFAKVHPRTAVPVVAIVTTGVLGVLFILIGTFERLADAFVTSILPFYALAVAAIFVARRREKQGSTSNSPSFRVPGYPVTPLVFIAGVVFLLGNALSDSTSRNATLLVFGIILAGIPLFYWKIRKAGSR
jgi:APA family basic amino acid/polyamine antiporter